MKRLVQEGQLSAYRHRGFWQCMDTLRDKNRLEELWDSGNPPWKVWDRDEPQVIKIPQASARPASAIS